MKYEILEHPSELRIRVYGKTLEELFSNAVLAMSEILNSDPNMNKVRIENEFLIHRMHPLNCRAITVSETSGLNDPNVKKEIIKIESVDLNSLLVDFLSEILAKSQINKAVYMVDSIRISCHSEFISESHNFLKENGDEMLKQVQHDDKGERCILESRIIGYPVDHFDEDIKAVTYEDLDIKQIDGIWQTVIVFDI